MNKIDISKWRDDIIKSTCELIQIASVYQDSTNISKPFGTKTAEALEYMLNLGEKLGFKTKNIDGYCGYIEFGEGEELIGIVGHLDVVPEGEGWKHEPFAAEIEDGKIYGRGVIDDKGPVMASLYAMKAVMDQANVNKRVRLILGLNEERDWKCIEYYKKHEEWPTIGFSPDADFPCIYAEKGLLTVYLKQNYINNADIIITDIDCKENAINVVPKYCKIELKINSQNIDKRELKEYARQQVAKREFDIEIEENENVNIISHGIPSHAAHPESGRNAISMALIILNDILQKYKIKLELLDKFSQLIGIQYYGENLGINMEDESGKLTLNVGNCKLEKDVIEVGMNLRIPIKTSIDEIENKFQQLVKESQNLELNFTGRKEPLYIPKDNKLVKILCDTFNEVTGNKAQPIAIGGATYARAFDNCLSFGANMPGQKDMCHQVDEFITVENLLVSCQIYAEAIYKLANL